MTVPVETEQRENGVRMRFFLPVRYTAETAPRPTDSRVRIVRVPEETLAIQRFAGSGEQDDLGKRTIELLEGISATRWLPSGDATVLFYNAPFTLSFLRRNEVAVAVAER